MTQYICEEGHLTEEMYFNPVLNISLCSICVAVSPHYMEYLRTPFKIPKGYTLVKENEVIPFTPGQVLQSSDSRFNYMAMDKDCKWYLYENGLIISFEDEIWENDDGEAIEITKYLDIKSDKPWDESLIYRGNL